MWTITFFMFFIFLITGVTLGITPLYSRHSAPFSVSLPIDYLQDSFVEVRKKRYAKWNIIGSMATGLPLFFTLFINDPATVERFVSIYTIVGTLFLIVLSFGLYLKFRQEILEWKKTLPEESFQKSKKIVVDSQYYQKLDTKGNFSIFIWQFAIIICTVLITFAFYSHIPPEIPIHWNSAMEVDRYIQKSPLGVLGLPLIQFLLIPVFNFSHYSFIQSKQKLSPLKPVVSGEKSRLFRKAWSRFLWMTAITTQLLLSLLNLFSLFLKDSPFWPIMSVVIVYTVGILAATIYLTLKYGQAGERLKLPDEGSEEETYYEDPEDERKWLGGIFYYNPEDPSIFVEKRFGIGTTINMARWQSWVFILGLIVFIILITLVSFALD